MTGRRRLFAAALLACCALAAHADEPWSLLAGLPPTVDAAAVLDRPGVRFWEEDAGRAARAAISGTGLFSKTERAWAGLSAALGYTEAEAARALLGGRVVVVWEGLAKANGKGAAGAVDRADTRWAMVTELDRDTARAVRARLNASPRRTTGGRVLYSLDAGRVLMALSDPDETGIAAEPATARTRMVIAPERAAGLMVELLNPSRAAAPDAETGDGSMGERARAVLGNVEPGWAAVAALRTPGAAEPGVIEIRGSGVAWGLRFAAPAEQPASEAPTGVPVGVLDAYRDGVLLAAVFSSGPTFTDRGMGMDIRLRADARSRSDTESAQPLAVDAGSALILRAAPGPGSPGMLAQLVTHARASSGFGGTVDRIVSAMIGGQTPPEHSGAFPGAVRTHPIPDDPRRAGKPWHDGDAEMAWCLRPDDEDRSGIVSMAMGPRGSDPAKAAREAREAWARLAHDRDPTMITAGLAHPAALLDAFAPDAPEPIASGARSIERVEWTVRLRDGVIRGEVLLRPAPRGAGLGAGP